MTTTVRVEQERRHGCLVQLLWFFFIGWWAGQLWITLAWLLMLTIIGIPLSVKMLNKLPQVFALRGEAGETLVTIDEEGRVSLVAAPPRPQRNLLVRAVYFLLIGWWFSAIWMELGYLFCVTIIGIPIGFWMFDKTPAVVSLRR